MLKCSPPRAAGTIFWWVSGGLRLGDRGTDIITICQSLKAVPPNQNASTARKEWFLNCPEIEVYWWGEENECHCMFTEAYSTAAQALSSEGHNNLVLQNRDTLE